MTGFYPIVTAGTLAVLRTVYVWVRWRGILVPDTHEYTQGGWGLYPSPFGRLLGMGGETVLAVINTVSCFLFAGLAVYLAKLERKSLWVAGILVLAAPASWWSAYASVDTTAAAVLLLSYLSYRQGWNKSAVALAILAAGIHLLILPILLVYVLFISFKKEPAAAFLIFILSVSAGLALVATPYGGIVSADPSNSALGIPAFLGFVFMGGPFVLLYAWIRSTKVAIPDPRTGRISAGADNLAVPAACCVIGGAIACAMQRHLNVRYGLPALGFSAALLAPPVGWASDRLRASLGKGGNDAQAA